MLKNMNFISCENRIFIVICCTGFLCFKYTYMYIYIYTYLVTLTHRLKKIIILMEYIIRIYFPRRVYCTFTFDIKY